MKESVIQKKSFDFAVRTVKIVQFLQKKNEYVMSKQLLKSGTSIGANVSEATFAQSSADFISKMSIALKEANETKYWIDLLVATKFVDENSVANLKTEVIEIIKILTSIVKNSKK